MNLKSIIAASSFIIIHCNMFSQDSNFKLTDFKLPYVNYNELEFDFSFSNSGSYQNINDFSNTEYKASNNELLNYVSLRFLNFINTDRYQGSIEALVSFDDDIYKEELNIDSYYNYESYYDRNTSFQSFVLSESRLYFRRFFLELDPIISYVSSIQNVTDPRELVNSTIKNGYNEFKVALPFSFGFGRLEPVQDARLAIYILEELVKQECIREMPSFEKINAFAEKIAHIKNSRYFDVRLRDIEDMKEITRYLKQLGIIENEDIEYYTALRDQWDYSSLPVRLSGFRIRLGMDNSYSDLLDFDDGMTRGFPNTEDEIKRVLSYYGLFLEMKYHKPHNLYWQSAAYIRLNSINVRLDSETDDDDFLSNYSSKNLAFEVGYKLSFIPNSRTIVTFNLDAEQLYEDIIPDNLSGYPDGSMIKTNTFFFDSGIFINYYISPKFRLALGGSFGYMPERLVVDTGTDTDNKLYQRLQDRNISIGLVYKFF